jgi:hypothetical protein
MHSRRLFSANDALRCIPPASLIALTLLAFLCACSRRSEKSLITPGSPVADSIRFQYAVYLLPNGHHVNALTELHGAIGRFTNLRSVGDIPKTPEAMLIHAYAQKNVKKEYAPPDLKALQYFGRGISLEQAKALQETDEAFVLEFAHPKKYVWTALRAADDLVEEMARKLGGLIWDQETREVFSPDTWHQRRLASWVIDVPDLSTQIVIHTYSKGESVRAITLGMSKIGLPDVMDVGRDHQLEGRQD